MKKLLFPYGKNQLDYEFNEKELVGVLTSSIEEYTPEAEGYELVKKALEFPIASKKLSELSRGKQNIVIIASDHTRPVPSKIIIPQMLAEIRKGNPDADITILIATGCHRETTKQELINKFGEEIVAKEKIYIHDCDEKEKLVNIGVLPSGGQCEINKIALDADLLVAEGFIEPHFFAGFSGGRKSVLPGIASKKTVLANHCSKFIDSPYARTGILEGNPIHRDMLSAARQAKLAYIVNVVINAEKEVVYAVAGDVEQAHKAGRDFLCSQCKAAPVYSDIAISTNGGYPLDQNIYQAVKGMTAAEATVNKGGVIIMLSQCGDGHGGESFYETFRDEKDLKRMTEKFVSTPPEETIADQWESQILARILQHASVILVSDAADDMVRDMHMTPAHSLNEALGLADAILAQRGINEAKIVAIPDGVSLIVG